MFPARSFPEQDTANIATNQEMLLDSPLNPAPPVLHVHLFEHRERGGSELFYCAQGDSRCLESRRIGHPVWSTVEMNKGRREVLLDYREGSVSRIRGSNCILQLRDQGLGILAKGDLGVRKRGGCERG